ncbi:MAG TPA: PP2C family serine/threonine-protein phosphatase [Candidatus Competibacteraceae bacterium]|nr:PP2C family serine/threonine-protein phosphatase [Candidatus Competibacteraceae bacterium]HRZ07177.1 PP2C family serine/threonine-protein phosphatase [Candidatus Competibacteraceae bacterium]HSA47999.1 PP2C family serine/threonine-protein phosphatase [Candidatus Competibacteraceae bacterium]
MTAWRTLKASVRGAAHVRAGLPSQDAVRVARHRDDMPLIVALADGHGSAKSFRSRRGARLAVVVAQKVCGHLFQLGNPSQIKRWAEEQLPLALVRHWQAQVAQALQRQPFTPQELEPLDAAARRQVEALPALAYGTTLLTVVIAANFILYLQLGDGDILTVSAQGDVERPIPKDARLIANETTSLCSAKAWNEVQVYFQTLAGAPPAFILAATDGYANAYRDDASFQQVARDYWTLLRDEGDGAVKPYLQDWLNEASQQGSGDDISVGIIWQPVGARPK